MAYTVSYLDGSESRFQWGNKKIRIAEVTLTGTYPTGGEALNPRDFGMSKILHVLGNSTEAAGQTSAWQVHWDRTNNKLKLMGLAVAATGQTEHGNIAYAAVSVGHLVLIGR
jgi:di/tripeptidase